MITSALVRLWNDENGQDLVEYSLLLAFLAIAAVALLSTAKTTLNGLWTKTGSALNSASTAAS